MITFKEALGLIIPYVKDRLMEQVKAVALIILYLIFFQTVILGIPIADASIIATGLALVVVGLAFFMEGLVLGLMPLGEVIGLQLPKKSNLFIILGGFLADQGRGVEGEPLVHRGRNALATQLPEDHWRFAVMSSALGACRTAQGRYDEAESLLTESLATLTDARGETHIDTQAVLKRLVALYRAWEKPEAAARFEARLNDA